MDQLPSEAPVVTQTAGDTVNTLRVVNGGTAKVARVVDRLAVYKQAAEMGPPISSIF